MDQEELLVRRIRELATLADRRGCATFTDFLNLNEQHILFQTLQKFSWIQGETFGGYEGAERRMAAFVPADSRGWEYPIACIRAVPLQAKFAEPLTHRDILGALMHLGIERSRTGDIAVCGTEFYLFCHTALAQTVCEELTRVRHTSVRCTVCDLHSFSYQPATQTVRGTVASVRLDALMALAFQSSRSSLLPLIGEGKVFVNGRLVTTNAYTPREQDIVSVRGLGRFRYVGTTGSTRKGRCAVTVERYV